jgi:hypothetical protein
MAAENAELGAKDLGLIMLGIWKMRVVGLVYASLVVNPPDILIFLPVTEHKTLDSTKPDRVPPQLNSMFYLLV